MSNEEKKQCELAIARAESKVEQLQAEIERLKEQRKNMFFGLTVAGSAIMLIHMGALLGDSCEDASSMLADRVKDEINKFTDWAKDNHEMMVGLGKVIDKSDLD